MLEQTQPIIAIATAAGVGAVGVIRVSGADLASFIKILLGMDLMARRATLCTVKDANKLIIDKVVAIYFNGPNSYTGEDILELQGHGGPTVLNMLVQRCFEISNKQNNYSKDPAPLTLRMARPGEFTERAFLNGKIDLAQAEAVMDLISASTRRAAQGAIRSLQGEFSDEINNLKHQLINLRVWVEASIDFPEEEIDFIESRRVFKELGEIERLLKKALEKSEQGRVLAEGVQLVIAGQPNAGKSSLMNALSGEEVSIVTSAAGTTRDIVSQTLSIAGVPFHVFDTAGLRQELEGLDQLEGIDAAEQIGMSRAWRKIEMADVVIFLHDLTRISDIDYSQLDQKIFKNIQSLVSEHCCILDVYNKEDLITEKQKLQTFKLFEKESEKLSISAARGEGIDKLKESLLATVGLSKNCDEGVYVARQRHVNALKRVVQNIQKALEHLSVPRPALEIVAEELRLAQNELSTITGEFTSDDLLGGIFSSFCIGK